MNIETAKRYLRACNLADEREEDNFTHKHSCWQGGLTDLCGDNCYECTTPDVLRKVFPELREYRALASIDELRTQVVSD